MTCQIYAWNEELLSQHHSGNPDQPSAPNHLPSRIIEKKKEFWLELIESRLHITCLSFVLSAQYHFQLQAKNDYFLLIV